jgi:hypothetical protein
MPPRLRILHIPHLVLYSDARHSIETYTRLTFPDQIQFLSNVYGNTPDPDYITHIPGFGALNHFFFLSFLIQAIP